MSQEIPSPPEQVAKHLNEEPRRKVREGIQWFVIAILMLGFIAAFSYQRYLIEEGNKKTDANATKLEQVVTLLDRQRNQFEECKSLPKGDPRCATPVVPPVTITPERPESSPAQKVLSVDEVRTIAQAVAADTKWQPTPAQYQSIAKIAYDMIPKQPSQGQIQNMISVTVASYCANDRCRSRVPGPPGTPGRPGADSTIPGPTGPSGRPGADSTIPGPPGQNATDEQVAAQVLAFCAANNDCKGPKGDTGRGLVSLTCNEEGHLVATYTDGDPDVIENSDCKVEPAPTVTVTETVTPTGEPTLTPSPTTPPTNAKRTT